MLSAWTLGHHPRALAEEVTGSSIALRKAPGGHKMRPRMGLPTRSGGLTICIHLIDHVLQLCFGGVLAQGSHHCPQLLGGDGAISILVKEGEGLLELWGKRGNESEVKDHRESPL